MPGEGSALFKEKDGLRTKRLKLRRQPASLRPRKKRAEDEEEDEGFLALGRSNKGGHHSEDSESSDDRELPSYRAIDVKPKANPALEGDSSDEGPESEEEEVPALDQSNPLKWRSIQLSRQVKEHPEDIDSWLELVDHQEALLRAGESLDHKVLESEAHSFAEIKVSMLESALSHVTNPKDRNRVLNYLMREGVKVWNTKTAEKKWSAVTDDEQHNFPLWKTHLDNAMSNIASFQYDDVKQMLLTRLHQATTRSPSEPRSNDWSEATYVFLRATRFIHDAGYKELAVAAWQAVLELNFFKPRVMGDKQAVLDCFRDFWESEVPRIGEADAQGWRHFVESASEANAPEPLKFTAEVESYRNSYKAWAVAERSRAEGARLPARMMDEGTEDDPFRVVMYSDIEPLLFFVPEAVWSRVSKQLLDAFLIFSGRPPCFYPDEWIEAAWQDQFLTGARDSIRTQGVWESEKEATTEEVQRRSPAFAPSILYARHSPELLFPGGNWFNFLGSAGRSHIVDRAWMLNATRQVVHGAGVEGLACYFLSLSSTDQSLSVKKLAKSLLRQFPTNAGLYDAYALAEYAQGNRETAIKVLSSASDMFKVCVLGRHCLLCTDAKKVVQSDAHGHGLLLWKTWAWFELEAGNKTLAVKRLCSSVDDVLRKLPDDGTEVSRAYILKARQIFSSHGEDDAKTAQVRAECLALLTYLTADGEGTEPISASQGNISAAMAKIDDLSHDLKFRRDEGTALHEGLLQFAARLLYFNATRGYVSQTLSSPPDNADLFFRPFRRKYMREQLVKYIGHFPRNTIFLSLLEWSDSSLRVVDETRTLLYDKAMVSPHDCVSSRIFAVEHELNRGNANTTRAAFEHAVASDASRSSVQVWISYIRFCHGQKELRPKAKDVFYRALRHCPWSKDVMMEAFGTLLEGMDDEALRSVYNTMTAKGMRLHVDMEEFLGKR
jgi:hypothetical protein